MAATKLVPLALSLALVSSASAQTASPPVVNLGQAPAADESAVVAELTVVADVLPGVVVLRLAAEGRQRERVVPKRTERLKPQFWTEQSAESPPISINCS